MSAIHDVRDRRHSNMQRVLDALAKKRRTK